MADSWSATIAFVRELTVRATAPSSSVSCVRAMTSWMGGTAVTRRRHELAVRLALGADHSHVLRMVMGEGAALIVLGLLLGVPGIFFAGRLVRGVLVGVSPSDPVTLSAVALGLGGVALLACYLPARRATGVDPNIALRSD